MAVAKIADGAAGRKIPWASEPGTERNYTAGNDRIFAIPAVSHKYRVGHAFGQSVARAHRRLTGLHQHPSIGSRSDHHDFSASPGHPTVSTRLRKKQAAHPEWGRPHGSPFFGTESLSVAGERVTAFGRARHLVRRVPTAVGGPHVDEPGVMGRCLYGRMVADRGETALHVSRG